MLLLLLVARNGNIMVISYFIFISDLQPLSEGLYEFGSVLSSVLLSDSFLGIGSLVFFLKFCMELGPKFFGKYPFSKMVKNGVSGVFSQICSLVFLFKNNQFKTIHHNNIHISMINIYRSLHVLLYQLVRDFLIVR